MLAAQATVQALVRSDGLHRARCFTSVDIPAHYSCSTGYRPSIDPLRRQLAHKRVPPAAAARRAFPPDNNPRPSQREAGL
jgi:hypothetical protein